MHFAESLPPGWRKILEPEFNQEYFGKLSHFLTLEDASGQNVFPPRSLIFSALQSVDYDQVKVVILGQDPYHGVGQAIGMSFAVPNEFKPKPPSLKNIFKEISSDLSVDMRDAGSDLSGWAKQGVLLLNAVLTVREAQAFSHRDQGWETFTDQIIRLLDQRSDPMVFLLWGAAALKKKALITSEGHFILEAAHPSPLSAARGFLGCRHFSKTNEILARIEKTPIDWARTVEQN